MSVMKYLFSAVFVVCTVAVSRAAHFHEDFPLSSNVFDRWIETEQPEYSSQDYTIGKSEFETSNDTGLVLSKEASRYGLTALFSEPLNLEDDDTFVLQYDVQLQEGLTCGGAYLKVLSASPRPEPTEVNGDTPYIVMFGPDKCGATNKVHLIFRHQNPVNKKWEEKHLKSPPAIKDDDMPHEYRVAVRPDNTFEVWVDGASVKQGSLLEDFDPPFNPPKQIPDPEDEKPEDWVDEAKIPDPDAKKPDDWDEDAPMMIEDEDAVKPAGWLDDEPEYVPDPSAEKPEDWDDEEDGDWEAPLVPNPRCAEAPGCGEWKRPKKKNPAYKGKWTPPMIDNPAYKGEWKPRMIDNPDYFVDERPHKLPPMAGVTIEVWTMSKGIIFDNILITKDEEEAVQLSTDSGWGEKSARQLASKKDREAQKRIEAREKLLDGSTWGYVLYYQDVVVEYLNENTWVAVLVGLSIAGGFLLLVARCCFSEPDSEELAEDDAVEPEGEEEELKEEIEEEDEKEGQGGEEGEKEGDDGTQDQSAKEESIPPSARRQLAGTRKRAPRTQD